MKKLIIGMIHLLPLNGNFPAGKILDQALEDLEILTKGGVDGVLVENDGDDPQVLIPGEKTVTLMTEVVAKIVAKTKLEVGVEVLLNHPKASLKIAHTTGAQFIRTDYFVDKMWRPKYGEIPINPLTLMNYRHQIGADNILVWADIQVKYAKLLETGKSIAESVNQAIKGGASAVIITGNKTGESPTLADLKEAKLAAKNVPVLVGSGLNLDNVQKLLLIADGAIVGTTFKTKGRIDLGKVRSVCKLK